MRPRHTLLAGVTLMGLAVALGAFGAHALRGALDPRALEIWQTAVRYQAWHGLGLIGLGMWMERRDHPAWSGTSAWALLTGALLFSGSLYALALSGWKALGMITPIGGLLMLTGWALWGWTLYRTRE